jgi:Ca-activated chloride channel homolog
MSALRIGAPEMAWLLWAMPVLVALHVYAFYRRKRSLAELAGPAGQMNVMASRARRIAKQAMTAGAVLLVAAALCRPSWNETPQVVQGGGRNVVFVLDVSRSMLARDVAPNRLERAKLAVDDMVNVLDGERVALVAFAGSAILKCPLTMDIGFFKLALKELSRESVPLGGSSIGAGIRKACEEIPEDERRFADVVLVSDGEDLGGDPLQAAREAGGRGIRIIGAGIGDEAAGEPIPVPDDSGGQGFLTWNGSEVQTRLDSALLQRLAGATPGGKYIDLGKGNPDLKNLFREGQGPAGDSQPSTRTIRRREERFQFLLALAVVLLCLEPLIGERRKR